MVLLISFILLHIYSRLSYFLLTSFPYQRQESIDIIINKVIFYLLGITPHLADKRFQGNHCLWSDEKLNKGHGNVCNNSRSLCFHDNIHEYQIKSYKLVGYRISLLSLVYCHWRVGFMWVTWVSWVLCTCEISMLAMKINESLNCWYINMYS